LSWATAPAQARTVYECRRDDRLSLATAPEPGSRCVPRRVNDRRAKEPNLWGDLGPIRGRLFQRRIGGRMVYSTREQPGWTEVDSAVDLTPAHIGLGSVGRPRTDVYAAQFRAAARRSGVEEAWLRAIAHAESGFDAKALSAKGARGVMQLMPEVAREYGVSDPYSTTQAIDGAARYIKALMRRYKGNLPLVAAAYNAGMGAVDRHRGVPPYAETRAYIAKVQALHAAYRAALGGPGGGDDPGPAPMPATATAAK
jgi:hypothetical protein